MKVIDYLNTFRPAMRYGQALMNWVATYRPDIPVDDLPDVWELDSVCPEISQWWDRIQSHL